MAYIFKGENYLAFVNKFDSEETCMQCIADKKWENGFECCRCGNKKYVAVAHRLSRECTKCKYVESATANTLFHKVKFGLRKAFMITFEMSCTTKNLSSTQMAKRYGVRQTTAWLFMQKVKTAMKSSGQHPMEGDVQVDEFVIGGREDGKQGRSYDSKKSKVVLAVELTPKNLVKRAYAKVIEDYCAASILPLFEEHISKEAKVTTDKWAAYTKIGKVYNITQIKSNSITFRPINTIVHQIKSWIRTIQSHVDKGHLQKYLDEYCYRLNRSIHKQTIFHNLFCRMVKHKPVGWNEVVLTK
jgi:transposase-like protein